MDANSKKKVPGNTITRDIRTLAAPTGNIYESVVILYKRANQIAAAEKPDLVAISEFENGELYYRRAQSANPIDINGEE